MADGLKLTDLAAVTLPVQATDLLYIVREGDGAESFKVAVSDLGGGAVDSVNGQTGTVVLDAGDVGAAEDGDVTASGLTMNTARILGRTSASTGAIQELTASGVLDIISSTRGTILYRGASGWAALAPGTDGYVLTTHSTGADPTWAAGGGGTALSANSLTALTGQTLTLATLDGNKDILLKAHGTGQVIVGDDNSKSAYVYIQNAALTKGLRVGYDVGTYNSYIDHLGDSAANHLYIRGRNGPFGTPINLIDIYDDQTDVFARFYQNLIIGHGVAGYLEGTEMSEPAAPAANGFRIYAIDSGGKTALYVKFASGAAQQIKIEP
jgi:hypothetical protein